MALTYTPSAQLGTQCPQFQLPTLIGPKYADTDIPAQTAFVVMFICNHCPYVQAIESRLIQLGHDLKNLGIPLIAICSNDSSDYPEDSFEELHKNYLQKKMDFIYLHDADQKVARQFGAVCTPDFFVYDKNKCLAYRGRLDDSWRDPTKVSRRELFEAVVKLQNGEPAPDDQVSSMGCSIKWITR